MRLRSALPAAVATALLAAAFVVPAEAVAVAVPSSTPTTLTTRTPGLPWVVGGTDTALDLHRVQVNAFIEGTDPTTADPAPITSVTVELRLHGAPTDTPAADTLTLVRDPASNWTWASANAVQLPLGVYDIDAEATDTQGHDILVPNAAQFDEAANVTVSDLSPAQATEDFDHPTVTVTGRVTITDPFSGAPVAPDHLAIQLQSSADGRNQTVYPAADGSFSSVWQSTDRTRIDFIAAYGTGPTPYRLISNNVGSTWVTPQWEASRIRLTSPGNVYGHQGGTVTLTGVAERQVGSAWVPAPGVSVDYHEDYGTPSGTVTAGADGRFSVTLDQPGTYFVDVEMGRFLSWSYPQGEASAIVHIPLPPSITKFAVTEDAFGEARITGYLHPATNANVGNQLHAVVQFSADGRIWHNVGITQISRPNLDYNQFLCWATYGGQANGYWRVYFPGSADWAPSFSPAVRIYRTPTTVGGGRPSTTHAYRGQTLSFSGTLGQRLSTWRALPHAKVILAFRPYHSSTWYSMGSAWTDSRGRFLVRGRAYTGGTWAVVYFADSTHIDSVGPQTFVHVG